MEIAVVLGRLLDRLSGLRLAGSGEISRGESDLCETLLSAVVEF